MNFANKTCIVTGGANGIGLCIVRTFAKEGCKVIFIDKNREAGEKAAADIRAEGGDVLFFCGDIADEAALEAFSTFVIESGGKIDYLINNACLSRRGILSGCGYEDFNYVLKVGVTAPYMLVKLLLEHFNEGGSIVNISSTRALMSQPDTESYTAAKGGISALTHALAVSLADRVRVNSVSPGWIDTSPADQLTAADKKQHPVQRVGSPADIAHAVLFLCGEGSGFITGQDITVDGGMTRQMIYSGDHGWEYTVD